MTSAIPVAERVGELLREHGSYRGIAKAINVDHAYLFRLHGGIESHPSAETLRKLGLLTTPLFLRAKP